MHVLSLLTRYARANARHIVKDFIDGIEAVVTLDDDSFRRLAGAGVIQELKRSIWHRVRMGIGEKRPS
jgi:hypothetical protein